MPFEGEEMKDTETEIAEELGAVPLTPDDYWAYALMLARRELAKILLEAADEQTMPEVAAALRQAAAIFEEDNE